MEILETIFGGTHFVDSDGNNTSPRRELPESPPVLTAPLRVWTQSHAGGSRNKGGSLGYYRTGDGKLAGVGDILCRIHVGYIENTGIWDDFSDKNAVSAKTIERMVKNELRRKYYKSYPSDGFHPRPELIPYFDRKGNFLGNDGMVFKIIPVKDEVSKAQLGQ